MFPLWTFLGACNRTSAVVGLENGDFGNPGRSISALPRLSRVVVNDNVVGDLAESLHKELAQWIQYKLGKQYL